MKLSSKIYFFVFATITLTLSLLTVLMHFKYHATRAELVNTRFSILANDMKWVIERGLRLGINLEEFKNINNIIQTGLKQDKDILSVSVFKYENNKIERIYETKKGIPTPYIDRRIIESIFSTKHEYWSFDVGNTGYIGVSFKDAVGSMLGGLYMTYSIDLINSEEKKEIYLLYLRLLAAIMLIVFISYFITYKTITPLDKNLQKMNEIMATYIDNPSNRQLIDLTAIDHLELRKVLHQTISSSKVTLKSFEQLQKIIHEVENS